MNPDKDKTDVPQNEQKSYPDQARQIVKDYYNAFVAGLSESDRHQVVGDNDVYVVWFAKTLKNWKALVSTVNSDGLYFEVTFNGENNNIYVDQYVKSQQLLLVEGEPHRLENFHENLKGLNTRTSHL